MMEKSKFLILLIGVIGMVHDSRAGDPNALYLTPYIERGQIAIAKALSQVFSTDTIGVTSYSGYLTVNKTYNSNLFFWFFPAQKNSARAPVILWLQGGPGASSLYGLFLENGPFVVNSRNKLDRREFSWHKDFNLLYIDNPVGAGFSFTDNPAGYATNQVDVATNLFSAVRQFFTLFSELRGNPFYVTGESYGGKYVPALGYAIYSKRNSTDVRDRINLQGLAIGNGWTDPVNQINYGDYLYQLGYVDENDRQTLIQYQNVVISYINQGNYLYALAFGGQIILAQNCFFNNVTGYTSPYLSSVPEGYEKVIHQASTYLTTPGVGKWLHVGNTSFVAFEDTNAVITYLSNDVMSSVRAWLSELLDYYKVLIYNGQLDLFVGVPLTEGYLQKLTFSGAADYKTAKRAIWRVDGEVAGYVKLAKKLTQVVVRNAGHLAPHDQPKPVLCMYRNWIAGKTIC